MSPMNEEAEDPQNAKEQASFIDFMVLPLVTVVTPFLPDEESSMLLANLKSNFSYWKGFDTDTSEHK